MKNLNILLLILVFSCSDNNKRKNNTQEEIKLEGTWSSCTTDNTASQLIVLDIHNGEINETIDSFNNVTDCSGASDGTFNLNGTVVFYEVGASTFEPNATDVTIAFAQDIGCGADAPVYTYIKIENNVGFHSAQEQPSCDPATRGSGLGSYFTKISE